MSDPTRYADWAALCHDTRVAPWLDRRAQAVADRPGWPTALATPLAAGDAANTGTNTGTSTDTGSGARLDPAARLHTAALASCAPGPRPDTRARLFPGALLLLWAEALGGASASAGAEPLAAALECLHNATLLHDDLIDGHAVRRGQPTLHGRWGPAAAVLGGDALAGDALSLLGELPPAAAVAVLPLLGQAFAEVAHGQWLDEPAQWQAVAPDRHAEHWQAVCRGKLAIGNAGGALAVAWLRATGHAHADAVLQARVAALLDDFSRVSQILNDLGDWFDFAGLHTLSPSGRPADEESARKPLLGRIWLGEGAAHRQPDARRAVLARGRALVAEHRARALRALDGLPLQPGAAAALLRDFVQAPDLPAHLG